MKRFALSLSVTALLAGCAQPGGPAPGGSAQPGSTAAPSPATASAAPPASGRRATTCTVAGFAWQQRGGAHVNPTMTVSNNGFCNAGIRLNASTSAGMTAVTQPQHGRLVTSDPGMNPYLRYYPAPGYEGPDSFTVNTGSGGQVTADFAVTVLKP